MNTSSSLTLNHIEDIRQATLKMHGTERRGFLADITLKYCDGNTRRAVTIFVWGRVTIATGKNAQESYALERSHPAVEENFEKSGNRWRL
ncbi:MAG: hypothetical protein GY845_37165 [Planctomycetes bacterium]|nr:hypothetical protein [Planctomycetota bacterium]